MTETDLLDLESDLDIRYKFIDGPHWTTSNGYELIEEAREANRLRHGDFTSEEFQALCHHADERSDCTPQSFCDGCHDYQRRLFGSSERDRLMAENADLRRQIEELLNRVEPKSLTDLSGEG